MKLTKFTVASVERSVSKTPSTPIYFTGSGIKPGKVYISVRYQYKITDTNGNLYQIGHMGSSKPIRIVKGQVLRCFVGHSGDNSVAKIEFSFRYGTQFLSEHMFEKAKAEAIAREELNIDESRRRILELAAL